MRKMFVLRWLALICCLSLLAASAFAAKPAPVPTDSGTLTGKVTIAGTRTAIVGTPITAVGSAGTYTAVTNSKGSYTLTPLPGGYTVTAAAGYASQSFSVTIKAGTTTVQNFALSTAVVTTGVLTGTVASAATGTALAGAAVAADHGGYSAVTGSDGKYSMTVAAGGYALTASAAGFVAATKTASVVADGTTTTNFALAPVAVALAIGSLTATPDAFVEASAAAITLSAVVAGAPSEFAWTQLSGPKVPLTALSATSATADVSALQVAAEAELVFQLTIGDGTAAVSKTVTVAVQPADMVQYPAANVQIGGSSTAVARFQYAGAEWCLFNLGTALRATPVGLSKGAAYELTLPAFANDIEILTYGGGLYALVATGEAGITVVDIANPAAMSIVNVLPVNFLMENVTFTETGGSILYGNTFASTSSPIASLVSDGVDLYIANHEFGIHKTALANVFGNVREADGTLMIDSEIRTVQYAGEHGWGGPVDLLLYGGKLFAGLGAQGMGFDPASLAQVGRYNLYTDEARTEDYFGAMAVTQAAAADAAGDLFVDDFTGMPDYRQVNYEITVVMKGTGTGEPTPWADMERNGKWYYEALGVDIAQQGARTIAYIAYALGGVVAVDITGFEGAAADNFLTAPYLGFFPAVPSNGPYETLSDPSSLLPYEGAGMLKEAGVTS
ncbi:MAG: carboxypeptidase regulatory-like domain-containing protein, partial [Trichloromonas sp.]|nr:carboxypeptidase regulatory-like domain-containing protein [Trichloromonas sp.]